MFTEIKWIVIIGTFLCCTQSVALDLYSGSMLAPKAGSEPPPQTQKNPSTKQDGLASLCDREPRLCNALHLPPLVHRQLLEIKIQ